MNALDAGERLNRTNHDRGAEADVALACRSEATILFTGMPELAESMARDIHHSSGWRHGPFVTVDCSMDERELDARLAWLLCDPAPFADPRLPGALPSQHGVVFLRGVDRLSLAGQIKLAEWLGHVRASGKVGPRRRVMASSRESLLSRVVAGTFDDRLYYRLSVIHIPLERVGEN